MPRVVPHPDDSVRTSPLSISDRLITLALEAERAEYADAAIALIQLAIDLPDRKAARHRPARATSRMAAAHPN